MGKNNKKAFKVHFEIQLQSSKISFHKQALSSKSAWTWHCFSFLVKNSGTMFLLLLSQEFLKIILKTCSILFVCLFMVFTVWKERKSLVCKPQQHISSAPLIKPRQTQAKFKRQLSITRKLENRTQELFCLTALNSSQPTVCSGKIKQSVLLLLNVNSA